MTKYKEGFIEKIASMAGEVPYTYLVKLADVGELYRGLAKNNLDIMEKNYNTAVYMNNYLNNLKFNSRQEQNSFNNTNTWYRTSPENLEKMKNQVYTGRKICGDGDGDGDGIDLPAAVLLYNTMGRRTPNEFMSVINNPYIPNSTELEWNKQYTVRDLRNAYKYLAQNDLIGPGGTFTRAGEEFLFNNGIIDFMVNNIGDVKDVTGEGSYRQLGKPRTWFNSGYKDFTIRNIDSLINSGKSLDDNIAESVKRNIDKRTNTDTTTNNAIPTPFGFYQPK